MVYTIDYHMPSESTFVEAAQVSCTMLNPCSMCTSEYERKNFCSVCDVPSSTSHLVVDESVIMNNRLHTCQSCGYTAHWTCHGVKSLMSDLDIMEFSEIRCVQCKNMIQAKHYRVETEPVNQWRVDKPEDLSFAKDLKKYVDEINDSKFYKLLKMELLFQFIIKNLRAFDRIKSPNLEDIIYEKLGSFANIWGLEKTLYYINKIMV